MYLAQITIHKGIGCVRSPNGPWACNTSENGILFGSFSKVLYRYFECVPMKFSTKTKKYYLVFKVKILRFSAFTYANKEH